jgi:hypothetical protein
MATSMSDIFLYGSIASGLIFLATLAFVTIEESIRRPRQP